MIKAHTWYSAVPKCMSLFVLEQLEGILMADNPTYEELKERIKELNKIVDKFKLTEDALKESEVNCPKFVDTLNNYFNL
jgi:predicted DNA-binding ArsR family transcriptional regulator